MSIWRRGLTLVVLTVLVFVGGLRGVGAQSEGGSGLIISPTRSELEVLPGNSSVIKVTLTNVSGVDITAKAEINDFDSDNETGQPKILGDTNARAAVSIRKFLSGVRDIELQKDEKKDFEIALDVPADAAGGAYYGIVRYSAIPKNQGDVEEEGRVALTASVGTLILLTVPGDIQEQVQIQSLKVRHDDSGGSFFTKAPNKIITEIKNNGNGFSKPFGRIVVTRAGSSDEVYGYELNNTDPKSNILPSSSRNFTDKLENIKTPGRYTVTANISHGGGGEILNYSTSFWYIPVWLLVAVGVGLLVLVLGAYGLYRKRFQGSSKKRRR